MSDDKNPKVVPGPKGELVLDTLRRFPDAPTNALAKLLVFEHGELFNFDKENARGILRYYRGQRGNQLRKSRSLATRETMPQSWRETPDVYNLDPGVWAMFGDVHTPFHHEEALGAAVDWCKKRKITNLLLNGDTVTCEGITHWPGKHRAFETEVQVAIDMLDWLRGQFRRLLMKEGNHETWFEKYCNSHAPELATLPMVSLEEVFGLEKRGIEYVEAPVIYAGPHLNILHGQEVKVSRGSVNTARSLFLKTLACSICAHTHSASVHEEKNVRGVQIRTWSLGCLCDLSPDYAVLNKWTHGFGVLNLHEDGQFQVELHPIIKGVVQ